MKRIILVSLLTLPAFAGEHPVSQAAERYTDARQIRAEQREQQKMEREQQREEALEPSSTAIGGSRSGELDIEKNREIQRQREFEKQKRLYEYENMYREGL